jgi:dTDP-4-amino-4,6-dideoxygalactose transaminase
VWHLFTIQTADPAGLGALLAERGVGTGRHYPDPVHLSPAYHRLGYEQGAFPVAEQVASRTLSLPIFPGIREQQLDHVVHAVREAFDGG